MAAYVITGPTFAPYGGKPIVVDGQFEALEGMTQPRSIVVVEFESMEQARRWYLAPWPLWWRKGPGRSPESARTSRRPRGSRPVASSSSPSAGWRVGDLRERSA